MVETIDEKIREELQVPPYGFEMFTEEMTPEERKVVKDKMDAENGLKIGLCERRT